MSTKSIFYVSTMSERGRLLIQEALGTEGVPGCRGSAAGPNRCLLSGWGHIITSRSWSPSLNSSSPALLLPPSLRACAESCSWAINSSADSSTAAGLGASLMALPTNFRRISPAMPSHSLGWPCEEQRLQNTGATEANRLFVTEHTYY